LVNNAGIAKYGTLLEINETDYDNIMNTNLKSVVFLTQLCVPHLIATKGKYIE
jgi:NADP-dependent 3-hydroxy acid dehydrogenase YdfG